MESSQPSYEELCSEVQILREQLSDKNEQITNLWQQLSELKRHVYGRKSEKLSIIDGSQGVLFPETVETQLPESPTTEVSPHKRSLKRGRKPLPEHIIRERVEYEPEERSCSGCGEELARIGEEVTEELDFIPSHFILREHVKVKRACSRCKSGVCIGKLPVEVQPIEGGRAGVGLLTHIIISKHCDHIPLYRQEQIYARAGVPLKRQRMCDWLGSGSELMSPLHRALKQVLLKDTYLHADETGIEVQDAGKEGKLHQGYLWGMCGPPGVYFEYSPSRAAVVAKEIFDGYSGYLHTDAYAGYNLVYLPDSCIRVGCYAHVRRKFIEVESVTKKSAGIVLKLIAELYRVESEGKHLTPEERLALRQTKSVKHVHTLHRKLLELQSTTLPKHPLAKALNYTLEQWDALTLFLTDGRLELDNNPIERQIRPIAIGRRNWLFAGSHEGAKRAAIFFSLINTCKMHNVNPYDWMKDIFKRIHTHPQSRIEELLPQNWTSSRR